MNILAIDTSTRKLSLAISRKGKVIKFRNSKLNRPLSSSIMPSIKKILADANMTLKQLDGFAVGLGPGSFTSLRVGLSTIKGFAFALKKPVVGISSLDILSMNVKGDHAQICTLNDAKRNLVYACVYEKNGNTIKKRSDYTLSVIDEVLKQIKGDTVFIGDGISLFKDNIKRSKKIKPQFMDDKISQPQARALITLAIERFKQNDTDNIDSLVPLYLYPEHCQVR